MLCAYENLIERATHGLIKKISQVRIDHNFVSIISFLLHRTKKILSSYYPTAPKSVMK